MSGEVHATRLVSLRSTRRGEASSRGGEPNLKDPFDDGEGDARLGGGRPDLKDPFGSGIGRLDEKGSPDLKDPFDASLRGC